MKDGPESTPPPASTPPRLGEPPSADGRRHERRPLQEEHRWNFAGSGGLGTALAEALYAMSGTGAYAEENYERALDALHGYPSEEVAALLQRGWDTLPESAYPDRWGVVQLLTDLRLPTATDVFGTILATPIPPERAPEDAHRFSTVGEEIILRTTAVEGLARLAAQDDAGAVDLLIRQVTGGHRSVQVASVMALRVLGEDAGVDVSILVPEEDQELLRIRRSDVARLPRGYDVDDLRTPGAGAEGPPAPPC
ncbi:hypothetical protein [Streptomyces sp. NPDC048650]|uniref:hypothetical protein n=1 Tax=Streptomyces sp. NPDC048650 TaxID=3365583 RepID=UPI00371F3619